MVVITKGLIIPALKCIRDYIVIQNIVTVDSHLSAIFLRVSKISVKYLFSQWSKANDSYFRYDDDKIKYTYHHSDPQLGKRVRWKRTAPHSLIYYIKYSWENWLNPRHTPDRINMTSILFIQCLQMNQHNDDIEMQCAKEQITTFRP